MKVNYLKTMKIFVLIALLILSACGMQGDLYLPDESSNNASENTTK